MKLFFIFCSGLMVLVFNHVLLAQSYDSIFVLKEVIVTGTHMNGIGWLNDYSGQTIYSGMKNEILLIDSLDANTAINNTRQIIGRIPGVNITENEMGGFTANGIGFRGLNPYQSIETNTRQNGYNISADLYGYNEAYYLPPMEAVKSITVLRDGATLAFGSQLGGMINYELKDGSDKPISITSSQTGGSYGLFNSFNSIGGTINNFKYYGFLQYRRLEGWRANTQQTQWSGFASLKYNPANKLQIGVEYTLLRNLIQMPGGLNDSLFYANPQQSLRSRNWLDSPWNITALHINYEMNDYITMSLVSSYLFSERNLIWRNEDIPPQEPDAITANLAYTPRELEREYFNTFANEFRLLSNYHFFGGKQSFSFGLRFAYSHLERQEGANGTTGSDFNLAQLSPWEQDMNFYTTNIAPYVENIFRVTDALSITLAVRLEYLSNNANGYAPNEAGDSNYEYVYANNKKSTRTFLLGAVSAELKPSDKTNFYFNLSQSYRPITYGELTPFGSIAKIDQNLKDASAYNFDFGFRGVVGDYLNFDVSFFFIHVKNDIGIIEQTADTLTYQFETNTGADDHKGIEMYAELNILGGLIPDNEFGRLGIYNSFGYTEASYVSGEYNGNYVPFAPRYTNRLGIDYSLGAFSINIQHSYTSSSYGEPANTGFSPDGLVGLIPSYSVIDISAAYRVSNYQFRFGVNNLTNRKYFTMRTDEYPGPGIIPSIGRMIYAGISLDLSAGSKNNY